MPLFKSMALGGLRPIYFIVGVFGLMTLAYALPTKVNAQNLIANGSFQESTTAGAPVGWIKGRWGSNSATFDYPVSGVEGYAARVAMTSRISGDAKWAFAHVPVEAGATYRYRNSYQATVPTFITAEFKKNDGSLSYLDLARPASVDAFTDASITFVIPAGVTSVTIFHLINQVGSLTIDDVALERIDPPPPPPPPPSSENLIANPSLEVANDAGSGARNWGKGRWGSNTATFTYPTAGDGSPHAAQVAITNYVNGDAKWFPDRVATAAGQTYEFSNQYRSTSLSYITVEFTHSDGVHSYLDLGSLPASGGVWKTFDATFAAPAGATLLTIFHVLKSNGTLEIDNYVLKQKSQSSVDFDKAYITLTFDDGHRSSYDVGLPIVESAGFTSSHYIITGRMQDGFPDYIKTTEILDIQARGHEVGAHTRTHPDLTTLTQGQMESEIRGSKFDLEAIGIATVTTFAYPLGAFNAIVKDVVRASGIEGARTTNGGTNLVVQDPYELRRIAGDGVPLATLKQEVDRAIAQKTWLVFAFHDVSANGGTYSVSPATLEGLVNYIKEKNVSVVSMKEGLTLLNP